jgi:hypothetical protein
MQRFISLASGSVANCDALKAKIRCELKEKVPARNFALILSL